MMSKSTESLVFQGGRSLQHYVADIERGMRELMNESVVVNDGNIMIWRVLLLSA